MANEFDLEKARAGHAVECNFLRGWRDCAFIGVRFDGSIVIEFADSDGDSIIQSVNPNNLRIKPKPPTTMWIQLYRNSGLDKIVCTNPRPSKAEASIAAGGHTIGEPQPVYVPDES